VLDGFLWIAAALVRLSAQLSQRNAPKELVADALHIAVLNKLFQTPHSETRGSAWAI
jgi:hypothetical protein